MLFIFSREKRLTTIILIAILVAITLIVISFYLVMGKESKKTTRLNLSLFDLSSYYCEYNMNVFSNKNQNLYNLTETYLLKDDMDYLKIDNFTDNFTYISTPNYIGVKSKEQLSSLYLENYSNEKLNLQSLTTFILLRKHILSRNEISQSCSFIENTQDNNIIYRITIDNNCDRCKKILGENLNITLLELIVDKNTNLPIEYIVYTNDEKVYLDINYEKFEINSNFDMKVFDF